MNANAIAQVDCRLTINGVTIDFKLDGPLVAMPKKSKRGSK